MQDLYTIGGAILLMVGIMFLVPYLKSKSVNVEQQTEQILKSVDISKLVLDVLPIAEQHKDKATLVMDVSKTVIEYIQDYSNEALTEDAKKKLSLEVLDKVLLEMKVTPTEEQLKLIKVLIEAGVDYSDEK